MKKVEVIEFKTPKEWAVNGEIVTINRTEKADHDLTNPKGEEHTTVRNLIRNVCYMQNGSVHLSPNKNHLILRLCDCATKKVNGKSITTLITNTWKIQTGTFNTESVIACVEKPETFKEHHFRVVGQVY